MFFALVGCTSEKLDLINSRLYITNSVSSGQMARSCVLSSLWHVISSKSSMSTTGFSYAMLFAIAAIVTEL